MKWLTRPLLAATAVLVPFLANVAVGGDRAPRILQGVTYFRTPARAPVQVGQQTLLAMPASKPVKIDGALDDEAWQHAALVQNFRTDAGNVAVHAQTLAKTTFDDEFLYVAWECLEPLMNKLRANGTARDGNMKKDDRVELLLDSAGDGTSFFFWTVNPTGTVADSRVRYETVLDVAGGSASRTKFVKRVDWGWDSQVLLAVGRTATAWTVEMAIPWEALGLGPAAGSVMHVNFRRFRAATDTQSSWASSPAGRWGREVFGVVKFGGSPLNVRVADWGPPWIGENELRIDVANVSNKTLSLRARAATKSDRRNQVWSDVKLRLRRGRKKVLTLPYRLVSTGEARQQVSIEVIDRKTEQPLWRNSVAVRPPEPLTLRAYPWIIRPSEPIVCFVLCRLAASAREDAEIRLRLVDRSDGVVVGRARVENIEAPSGCVRLRTKTNLQPGSYAIGAEMVDSEGMTVATTKGDLFVVQELDYNF